MNEQKAAQKVAAPVEPNEDEDVGDDDDRFDRA